MLLLVPYHFCALLCPSLHEMFLDISNFLEEISSLSHSIVFLYFFALITEEGFLISPCFLWDSVFKWVYLSFSPLLFASLAIKVMLKILQARLQQYMNWELPDIQAGFRKGRGTRDQIASICWIIEKENSRKTSTSASFDYVKTFDCVDHNRLWNILKELGIPHYFTCLLRILYARQKQHIESDMEQWTGSKLGKEYTKAIYCHPVYLTYMQSTSREMLC